MDSSEATAKKYYSQGMSPNGWLEMIMSIILMDQDGDNEMELWLGKWKPLHWVLIAPAINHLCFSLI